MKFNQALLVCLLVCCTSCFLSAQNRVCSAPEVLENMLKSDPDMQERLNAIERHTQEYTQRAPSVSERTVIHIPVVVHVVHNSAAENISDAQVQSQIDVLNKDFRKLNAEAASIPSAFLNISADIEINFCLATVTPNGTATNGIDRHLTSKTSWTSNDDMKRSLKDGVAAWDASRYLNIWVCNLGSGSLGYSSFPGATPNYDGVVIDYRYFGTINTRAPFHLGRTTTHEVGHWLGLFHIWGDTRCGDDHVEDTPLHHGANFGCPTYPAYNATCGDNIIEMPMNFMDYTNDACMSMFTLGQKSRMRSYFTPGGARYSIIEANLCGAVVAPLVCLVPTGFSLSNVTETTARIAWANTEGARSYTLEYKANYASVWTSVNNIAVNSLTLTNLTGSTIYNVRVKTECHNGGESAKSNIFNFVTSIPSISIPTCSDNFEPNNTHSAAELVRRNRTEKAFIGYSGDRDWYYFKANQGENCTINLSNLAADYDIKLYDSRLRLLKSSENMGTSDETISYLIPKSDSFLISIYGYNGAFDADNCYSLFINTNPAAFSQVYAMSNDINGQLANLGTGLYREANTEGALKVFPNPTTDGVALQIAPESESNATIILTNISGQTVLTESRWVSKSANTIKLDLSAIPSGLYFVSVQQGTEIWTQKLVKK